VLSITTFEVMHIGFNWVVDLDECAWCATGVCTGHTEFCVVFMMRW